MFDPSTAEIENATIAFRRAFLILQAVEHANDVDAEHFILLGHGSFNGPVDLPWMKCVRTGFEFYRGPPNSQL